MSANFRQNIVTPALWGRGRAALPGNRPPRLLPLCRSLLHTRAAFRRRSLAVLPCRQPRLCFTITSPIKILMLRRADGGR